ncbi:MAG: 4Fe-4S dicluster domain-containing protein [Oscillospiraceae bacterium]|jgi:Na+-translocating ferredoxin:NAD+ oxidoreductase RnfC subunit|nr:4Fe-4S dicluster domain-containing protein [Oscillospiraceae bacterium]
MIEQIRQAGVVGAGGAGFPTHVKLCCTADTLIANGAECEPLLYVDQSLMERHADRVVAGLETAMAVTGAETGIVATKAHYAGAVAALSRAIAGRPAIRLHLLRSYYPAGDEKSLIYEVTGRLAPSGKLPKDVGCAVSNVGTLLQIADALEGKPVVDRVLTVGGDVPAPVTVAAPLGTPMRDLLALAGFAGDERSHALLAGGPCMGILAEDWDAGVTKTTGGLLVLPRTHPLITGRTLPLSRQFKLAQAVCCQCSQCTMLCPRHALGFDVQPHKGMRAMAHTDARLLGGANGILACCGCGVCTYYACPMGLAPARIMARWKAELGRAGIRPQPEAGLRADPQYALTQIPTHRLVARMGLTPYDRPAPFLNQAVHPRRVRISLAMHVGAPCVPAVAEGDAVRRGDLIARVPARALGAPIHASVSGCVARVTDGYIEITGREG